MTIDTTTDISLKAIGTVRSDRVDPIDDDWHSVRSRVELDPNQFNPESLAGLEDFSHVEVFFIFHRVASEKIVSGARHPRGRSDWPRVGIFAQRGKNRPNRLGATICEVTAVEELTVHIKGLDAIDGSPVIDLKPVMREFLPSVPTTQPSWVDEVMADYWRSA